MQPNQYHQMQRIHYQYPQRQYASLGRPFAPKPQQRCEPMGPQGPKKRQLYELTTISIGKIPPIPTNNPIDKRQRTIVSPEATETEYEQAVAEYVEQDNPDENWVDQHVQTDETRKPLIFKNKHILTILFKV